MTLTFGVEFELKGAIRFDGALDESNFEKITRAAFSKVRQNVDWRETSRRWSLKYDCSCGHELTSPAFNATATSFNKFLRAVDALNTEYQSHGWTNEKLFCSVTGLHVHIGLHRLTTLQKSILFQTFAVFQDLLLTSVPKDRKNSQAIKHYAYKIPKDWDGIYHRLAHHYVGISWNEGHNTLEIRFNKSTFKPSTVRNWVALILMIAYAATSSKVGDTCRMIASLKSKTGHLVDSGQLQDFKEFVEKSDNVPNWLMKNYYQTVCLWLNQNSKPAKRATRKIKAK